MSQRGNGVPILSVVNGRERYHYERGLRGREIYAALAADDELPTMLTPDEAGAILGLKPTSMAMRRQRRMGPEYVALSGRAVRYPRHALYDYLAKRYTSY